MNGTLLVQQTTYLSILIQFLTGLVGFMGIHTSLPQPHAILVQALKIELVVQLIEFFFYVFLIVRFNLKNMATLRYYDWFITTPTMLFTTSLVYHYLSHSKDTSLTLTSFVQQYKQPLLWMVFSNFGMLMMGYLGEIGIISMELATLTGFMFLMGTFYILYQSFGKSLASSESWIFSLFVGVWSFYGIVFLLPPVWKNTTYNFLDIVAKNFFGLYLFWKIRQLSKNNKSKE